MKVEPRLAVGSVPRLLKHKILSEHNDNEEQDNALTDFKVSAMRGKIETGCRALPSGVPKILMRVSEVLVAIEYVDSIGTLAQDCHFVLAD